MSEQSEYKDREGSVEQIVTSEVSTVEQGLSGKVGEESIVELVSEAGNVFVEKILGEERYTVVVPVPVYQHNLPQKTKLGKCKVS